MERTQLSSTGTESLLYAEVRSVLARLQNRQGSSSLSYKKLLAEQLVLFWWELPDDLCEEVRTALQFLFNEINKDELVPVKTDFDHILRGGSMNWQEAVWLRQKEDSVAGISLRRTA